MSELKLFAPADCIVSNTAAENDHALRQIELLLKEPDAVGEANVSAGAIEEWWEPRAGIARSRARGVM